MKDITVEIVSVGSELLSPHFQDTNSKYLTGRLNDLGLKIAYKSTVGDDRDRLKRVLREGIDRADLLLVTGGLGPTEDDRTKEILASVLGRKLVFNQDLYDKIKSRFNQRGISMPKVNRKQAFILQDSSILDNTQGTAPGIWLETESCTAALLPGPPHELEPMFEDHVWPRLQNFRRKQSAGKVIKVAGLAESKIDTLLSDLYPFRSGLEMSILAHPGEIELRLTAHSHETPLDASSKVENLAKKIISRLGDHVFSEEGEDLEKVVGDLLVKRKKTLALAESCTGGFLGSRITDIPGSSRYFVESAVVYSNQSKTELAGVAEGLITRYGAVSREVASAMASGIRVKAGSDYGLAITGIAGPGGGTREKPVGLVFTALAHERGTWVDRNRFLGSRRWIKFQSSQKALDMLRRHLLFGQYAGPKTRRKKHENVPCR